jgi:hypothetical protein
MNPKHPPGPSMTLGNMRELGVHRLIALRRQPTPPPATARIVASSACARIAARRFRSLDQLILKGASTSRPSGEWNMMTSDVVANGVVVGRMLKAVGAVLDVDARVRSPRGSHADARVCCDAGGASKGC